MRGFIAGSIAAITFTLWDDSEIGSSRWWLGTVVLAVVYFCGFVAAVHSEAKQ